MRAVAVAVITCASVCFPVAAARGGDTPATTPANAADVYRKAFDLLPRYPGLSERQSRILVIDDEARPTQEEYAEIVEKARPALELLRQAAAIDACEWEPVRKERQKLIARMEPFPRHLGPLAELARFSRLRALWHTRAGRFEEAYRDLADQLVVARHASRTPTTSAWRVQSFVSGYAMEDAAFHLPKAPPQVIEAFGRRLETLPAHGPLPAAIAVERKERVSRLSDLLTMEGGRDLVERQAGFNEVFRIEGMKPLPLDDLWDDPAKQEKVLVELDGALAALEKRVSLSDREYVATREQFLKKLDAAHPLVRRVAEEVADTWDLAAQPRANTAMLRTAIMIRLHGPDALRHSGDPFRDGPFKRQEIPRGYRLVSGLIDHRGLPVSLTVGRRWDWEAEDAQAK